MATETIRTLLIDGTTRGPQRLSLGNKVCQMFIIPKADVTTTIKSFQELHTPCLYILIMGEDRAYIGHSHSFKERIEYHLSKKDFETVYAFVDSSHTISKAHVEYLEYRAIDDAINAGSYELPDNKKIPKQPHLTLEMISDADKFYDDVKFLVDFVGCNIFYKAQKKESEIIFHCYGKGADAHGIYDVENKRFVVFKGSTIEPDTVKSFHNPARRSDWMKLHTTMQNWKLVLKEDYPFNTPSQASEYVLGRPANGWTEWKTEDNKQTLSDIYEH